MAKLTVVAAIALLAAACGIPYSMAPARLVIAGGDQLSQQKVLAAVSSILVPQGFDDLGLDEEMIALVERSGAGIDWHLADLRNQFTYLDKRRDLRVVVADHSDPSRKRASLPFDPPAGPFFELSVYEERPGGFSPEGHRFVSMLRGELERGLRTTVTMVTPPSPTHQVEYWRVTIVNGLALAANWALAFLITVAITSTLTLRVLKRLSASLRIKRSLFVLVNAWLATPLPFPVATILGMLLPNVFAFPWIYFDYYYRVQDVAFVSFPISILLCFLISLRVIPNGARANTAAPPIQE